MTRIRFFRCLLVLALFPVCSFNQIEQHSFSEQSSEVILSHQKKKDSLFQKGFASYYASRFQNQPTASGEPYDSLLYTAAHRSLPLQSVVVVENEKTGHQVRVRINDRGPFSENKLIDLSKAAAEKIQLTPKKGIVRVKLYVVD